MNLKKVLSKYTLWVFALVLFIYSAYRAGHVPIWHDEAMSYFYIFRYGIDKILIFAFGSSNNHILNSILARLSIVGLGDSVFTMRIPNVLAHAVYLTASILIARRCQNCAVQILAFLLLTLNPYLLDFFSLARGYGLACAFTMLSLHYAIRLFEEDMRNNAICAGALWPAWFAVLSNFSFLTYYISLVSVVFAGRIILFMRSEKLPVKGLIKHFFRIFVTEQLVIIRNVIMLMLIIVPPVLRLILANELYFGGTDGFVADTVRSLIRAGFHIPVASEILVTAVTAGTIVLFITIAAWIVLKISRKRVHEDCLGVFLILVTAISVSIAQHHLLGTKYAIERTALYYYLLFAVLTVLFIGRIWSADTAKPVKLGIQWSVVLFSLSLIVFWTPHLNVRHVFHYPDADNPEMLKWLAKDCQERRIKRPITLGISGAMLEPTINYYIYKQQLGWLKPVVRSDTINPGKGFQNRYDYFYLQPNEVDLMSENQLTVIKKFKTTGCVLARSTE